MTTTLPPGLEESAGESRTAPPRPAPDPYGVPGWIVVVRCTKRSGLEPSVRRLTRT